MPEITLEPPRRSGQQFTSDYALVLKQVQSQGLLGRRYRFYAVKIIVLLAAFVGVWVGFAFLGDHWAQVALAAALAVVTTQILFVSHEAAHKQIFGSHRANDWTALLLGTGICGISLTWWNTKHSRHHRSPNQIGSDPDIRPSILNFYPPDAPPRTAVLRYLGRRQGWWFFPLLMAEGLNLHVHSVLAVLRRPTGPRRRRPTEVVLLAGRLGLYPVVLFVFLSPGIAGAFLGVQLAVTGLNLGSVFAASHIGMPIVPQDLRLDFLRRQILTSRNLSGGRLASLATGGLNYQIEHHLFPSMARPHLPAARRLVRAACAEYQIDYSEVPIHRAWASVARHLNQVGLAGATLAACPTAATLRQN